MIGTTLGHYSVTAKLGEGGMGEVYRATDTHLGREVAIKVLPPAFTDDKERLARFEREAQLLAQLQHANIASVYGLEQAGGVRALVLELVEGPTLAERLESGPLPEEECWEIALRIAEALEAAHEKGIVHRDLKPQNIKSSLDGQVKVLDFGLAKATDPTGDSDSAARLAASPTLTLGATAQGIILGTAGYMAPEQAKGVSVDRRADIWAFGVVFYEMLTGRRLFAGDSVPETLASVLRGDLDLSELPRETPARIRELLRRCLVRNPKDRLRDVGEARVALTELLHRGASRDPSVASRADHHPSGTVSIGRRLVPWALAAVLAVVAVGLGTRSRPAAESGARPVTVFGVLPPAGFYFPRTQLPPLDLSADGRTLLFMAESEGGAAIFRRSLGRMEPTRLAGSAGGEQPILSPDGRWVAFFAGGQLRKIPAEGGSLIVLAEARAPRGAAWAPDGSLVYSPVYNSPLLRVPPTGGEPLPVTSLDEAKSERSHRWPQVLPDGRTVLFTVGVVGSPSDYDDCDIDAVRLDTGERRTVFKGARMARYTEAGYLVFQRRQTLLAVRFDPDRLETLGEPFVIHEGMGGDTGGGAGYFAVAATGMLAYLPESAILNERALVLADRSGNETELPIPRARFVTPRFSPSGDRVAYAVGGGGLADDDVFVYELGSSRVQRLTFDRGGSFPIWSPDGRSVLYTLPDRRGMASRAADGSGEESRLGSEGDSEAAGFFLADAWLTEGRIVVSDIERTLDVRLFDPDSGLATPLFASEGAAEYAAAISPDGRYIAYTSTESSSDEVFVETFPPGAGRWQVSADGGMCPAWSRDGKELFFVSGDTFLAAEVQLGEVFRSATPRPLFSGPYETCSPPVRYYDVDPDGRFVLVKPAVASDVPRELIVLDGWDNEDPERDRAR